MGTYMAKQSRYRLLSQQGRGRDNRVLIGLNMTPHTLALRPFDSLDLRQLRLNVLTNDLHRQMCSKLSKLAWIACSREAEGASDISPAAKSSAGLC